MNPNDPNFPYLVTMMSQERRSPAASGLAAGCSVVAAMLACLMVVGALLFLVFW